MPTKTRILIADDNKIARARLIDLLQRRADWQVCGEAENGQEATLKALELKPDIVILDLVMPVMDGISAAREIGKALPSIPILMFTLHDLPGISVEAKKAGVRQVVGKHHPDKLLSAIEELVKNGPPDSASANTEPRPSVSGSVDVADTHHIQPELDKSQATEQREPDTPTETD